ncbi:MAG: hypothetical protein JSS00_13900 [Proteobacteria bacterium]|nr:hypothetical protein [Pseudomonadota bacterium]
MKPLVLTPPLRRAAERCVWYEPPEAAIRDAPRLVAHILTFGSIEDVGALRTQYSDEDLREALQAAPPGIFDARSWAYWNLVLGRYDAPAPPTRRFR